eukprot:1234173-Amphidinium_carterae.1
MGVNVQMLSVPNTRRLTGGSQCLGSGGFYFVEAVGSNCGSPCRRSVSSGVSSTLENHMEESKSIFKMCPVAHCLLSVWSRMIGLMASLQWKQTSGIITHSSVPHRSLEIHGILFLPLEYLFEPPGRREGRNCCPCSVNHQSMPQGFYTSGYCFAPWAKEALPAVCNS